MTFSLERNSPPEQANSHRRRGDAGINYPLFEAIVNLKFRSWEAALKFRSSIETPAMARPKAQPVSLKGWQLIAAFLGQPPSVVQRWSKSGMPVSREVRRVLASPEELNRWIQRESAGEPIQSRRNPLTLPPT
jgi:hypothetical protein